MTTFFSPAKINLLLDIHGKREDGYHDLSSLIVGLDFGDFINIKKIKGSEDLLECNDPSIPCDENNLILKAMALLRKEIPIDQYFKFSLNKKIPSQAGFGGGSSNATTAIKGVLDLIGETLPSENLNAMLSQIGADCSFFQNPVSSMMTGKGEVIEPLKPSISDKLKGQKILIFKPSFNISTAVAYHELGEDSFKSKTHTTQKIEEFKNTGAYKTLIHNSFSKPLEHKYIALKSLLKTLNDYEIPSMISGSGSGCFSLLSRENTNNQRIFIKDCVKNAFGKGAFLEETQIL